MFSFRYIQSWFIILACMNNIRWTNELLHNDTDHFISIYLINVTAQFIKGLNTYLSLFHGSIAPTEPRPPHYWGFTITDKPHSVGLLWTSDQPNTEISTWQHITFTRERCPWSCEFRNRNPSKRAAVYPGLRTARTPAGSDIRV